MSYDRLRNNKGFTLIEVILTLAIFVIFIIAVTSVFNFELNTFFGSSRQYNIQSDIRIASDSVKEKVRYATTLTIMSVSESEGEIASSEPYNYIYVKDEVLYFAIFDSSANTHNIKTISGIYEAESVFSKVGDDTLRITLSAMEDSNIYKLSSDILLKNFGIKKPKEVINGTSDLAIRFND